MPRLRVGNQECEAPTAYISRVPSNELGFWSASRKPSRSSDTLLQDRVHGSYLESNWANVMWAFFTGAGVIPQANLDFLANAFFDHYGDELLPEVSFEVELEVCRLNVW